MEQKLGRWRKSGDGGKVGYGEHQEILPICQEEQQYSLQG